MIFITYYKSDGEILAPIIVSEVKHTLEDVFPDRAEELKAIFDYINIQLNSNEVELTLMTELQKNYKVNIETKQLELKQSDPVSIVYI